MIMIITIILLVTKEKEEDTITLTTRLLRLFYEKNCKVETLLCYMLKSICILCSVVSSTNCNVAKILKKIGSLQEPVQKWSCQRLQVLSYEVM